MNWTHIELWILSGVGFITVIHDNGNLPLAHLNGFFLEGGRKHRLSFTKRKQYLLGPPYSVCTDKSPRLLQAVFDRISNATFEYEEYICFEVCLQVYTYVSSTCVLARVRDYMFCSSFQIRSMRLCRSVPVVCSIHRSAGHDKCDRCTAVQPHRSMLRYSYNRVSDVTSTLAKALQ
jgi:hypothetical protein